MASLMRRLEILRSCSVVVCSVVVCSVVVCVWGVRVCTVCITYQLNVVCHALVM